MRGSIPKPFDFSVAPGEFARIHLQPFWDRRRIELAALCRLISLETPSLSSEVDLPASYEQLRGSGPRSQSVLRSPELILWINVTRYFVMRNMHRSLPIGHVKDHISDLARFALATACADGRTYEAKLRIPENGRLSLPGLGLLFAAGRDHAGEIVRLQTNGKTLTAAMGSSRFTTALHSEGRPESCEESAGWKDLTRIASGEFLNDSSEMLRPHIAHNPKWKLRPLDREYVSQWRSVSREACSMLSSVADALWISVQPVVSSIVPLQAPADVNLSATSAEVLGCICTSLPVQSAVLAETLVHEAAHTTLHILSDGTKYWESKENEQLYNSPWRDDLRPISGMVHGIFAFLAVADFWALLLSYGGAAEFERLGRKRLRTVSMQLEEALIEVMEAPGLTEEGRCLLAAAEQNLRRLKDASNSYELNPQEDAEIKARKDLHRARASIPLDGLLRASKSNIDPRWSKQLGSMMPPPINHLSSQNIRREVASDRIHLVAFKGEAVLTEWESLLQETANSETESTALVEGCLSYGRGRFHQAVESYARYVEYRWDDIDAWRLLAAALRRAGRFSEAEAIVFNVDSLHELNRDEMRQKWGSDWPLHLSELADPRVRKDPSKG
jgi:HEXXH motif-containing protein